MELVFTNISNILSKVLKCFALFVPFGINVIKESEMSLKVWQEIYAVFLSIIVLVLYVVLLVQGVLYRFKSMRTSSVLLTVLVKTALTLIAFLGILGNTFWNRNYWNQYLKLLKMLFAKLDKSITRHNMYFSLEIIMGHIVFLMVVGLDIFMIYDGSTDVYNFIPIVIKNYLFYYTFLLVIIIYNTALTVKYQFFLTRVHIANALNLKVNKESYIFKLDNDELLLPTPVVNNKTVDILLDSSKIVNVLFELVQIFNNLFGQAVLLITFSTVLQTLQCLNELLVLGEQDLLDAEIVSSCILEALVFLVSVFLLINII